MSLRKLKAITATLCAPSAGLAKADTDLTGPATAAPGTWSSMTTSLLPWVSAGSVVGRTPIVPSAVWSRQCVLDSPSWK